MLCDQRALARLFHGPFINRKPLINAIPARFFAHIAHGSASPIRYNNDTFARIDIDERKRVRWRGRRADEAGEGLVARPADRGFCSRPALETREISSTSVPRGPAASLVVEN